MKVGDKVKGFIFENGVNGVTWNDCMNDYIGEDGVITFIYQDYFTIDFQSECYNYPLSLSHLAYQSGSQKDQHYNNENGSLYLFAQQHGLNAYEFDCVKRIVRCRKKGQFKEDLEKTKRVIDLYLKEHEL